MNSVLHTSRRTEFIPFVFKIKKLKRVCTRFEWNRGKGTE